MSSGQETLLGYFRRFINCFEKRVGVNRTMKSLRAYRNAYNHIERFLQTKYKLSDIPFSALDRSFIDKYDLYLRTERNLAPGTIINLTVQLKTIVARPSLTVSLPPVRFWDTSRCVLKPYRNISRQKSYTESWPLRFTDRHYIMSVIYFCFPVLPGFHIEICVCWPKATYVQQKMGHGG